jgi:hypothetical protein
MTQQRSRGGSAALWGAIIGLILAALVVLHQLVLADAARRSFAVGGSLIYSALALLIAAALYFLAGFLAARRANAIEAGLFAGLIAGVIVGVTVLVMTVLVLLVRDHRIAVAVAAARHPALVRSAVVAALVRGVLGICVQALIGAGLGALGGLAGRRRTPPFASGPYPYNPYTQPATPTPQSAPPSAPPPLAYPYAYPPATPLLADNAPTIIPQR